MILVNFFHNNTTRRQLELVDLEVIILELKPYIDLLLEILYKLKNKS
jgi:hypothetical protein